MKFFTVILFSSVVNYADAPITISFIDGDDLYSYKLADYGTIVEANIKVEF